MTYFLLLLFSIPLNYLKELLLLIISLLQGSSLLLPVPAVLPPLLPPRFDLLLLLVAGPLGASVGLGSERNKGDEGQASERTAAPPGSPSSLPAVLSAMGSGRAAEPPGLAGERHSPWQMDGSASSCVNSPPCLIYGHDSRRNSSTGSTDQGCKGFQSVSQTSSGQAELPSGCRDLLEELAPGSRDCLTPPTGQQQARAEGTER